MFPLFYAKIVKSINTGDIKKYHHTFDSSSSSSSVNESEWTKLAFQRTMVSTADLFKKAKRVPFIIEFLTSFKDALGRFNIGK